MNKEEDRFDQPAAVYGALEAVIASLSGYVSIYDAPVRICLAC